MGFYFFWALALTSINIVSSAMKVGFEWQRRPLKGEDILVASILGAISFIGAVGTHNFIGYNLVLTLAPWFALLVFLISRSEVKGLPIRVPVQIAIASFAAMHHLRQCR
jgi:hypothetical protein